MTLDHDFDPRLGSAFPGDEPTPTNAAVLPEGEASSTGVNISVLAAKIREAAITGAAAAPGEDHPERVPAPVTAGSGVASTPSALRAPEAPTAPLPRIATEAPATAEANPRNWRRIGIIGAATGLVAIVGTGVAVWLNRGGDNDASAAGQGDTKASSLTVAAAPTPAASATTTAASAPSAEATPSSVETNKGVVAERDGYAAYDLCDVLSPQFAAGIWPNVAAQETCDTTSIAPDVVSSLSWINAQPKPGDTELTLFAAGIRDDSLTAQTGVTETFDEFAAHAGQVTTYDALPNRAGYTVAYGETADGSGKEIRTKVGPYVLDVVGSDLDELDKVTQAYLDSNVIVHS